MERTEQTADGNPLDTRIQQVSRRNVRIRRITALLIAAACLWVLFGVVFGAVQVSGNSMAPTVSSSQWVFYLRYPTSYRSGDAVLVRENGQMTLRRIAAEPGSCVAFRASDTALVVDGKLTESSTDNGWIGNQSYPLILADDEYFVLGDNRKNSRDSRTYGPVKEADLCGKLLFVLPFSGKVSFTVRAEEEPAAKEKPKDRYIESFEAESPVMTISAAPGTTAEDLKLPKTLKVKLTDGTADEIPVTWTDAGLYKPSEAGTYQFSAVLNEHSFYNGSTPFLFVTVDPMKEPEPKNEPEVQETEEKQVREAQTVQEQKSESTMRKCRRMIGSLPPRAAVTAAAGILLLLLLLIAVICRACSGKKIDRDEYFRDL